MSEPDQIERQSDAVMQLRERQESALRSTDAIEGQMRNARLRMRVLTFGMLIWKVTNRLNLWREGAIVGAILFCGLTSFMLCDTITGQRFGAVLCGLLVAAWSGFSLWYLYFRTTEQSLGQSVAELREHLELCRGSAMDAMANVVDLSKELDNAESKLGEAEQEATEREQRLARLYMQDWADMEHSEFVSFIVRVLYAQGFRHDPDFGGDDAIDLIVQKDGTRMAIRVIEADEVITAKDVNAAIKGKTEHVCHQCAVVSAAAAEPDISDDDRCLVVDGKNFRNFVLGRVSMVS